MGNCTATIKKKNVRPYGKGCIAVVALSGSYATGGDTVPISIFNIGKRLSHLLISGGHTTPSGHHVELIPGATEYAAPLLRVRNVTTGAELANASANTGETVTVEAFTSPYK